MHCVSLQVLYACHHCNRPVTGSNVMAAMYTAHVGQRLQAQSISCKVIALIKLCVQLRLHHPDTVEQRSSRSHVAFSCRWHLTSLSYTPCPCLAMLVAVTGIMHLSVSMLSPFLPNSMHAKPILGCLLGQPPNHTLNVTHLLCHHSDACKSCGTMSSAQLWRI